MGATQESSASVEAANPRMVKIENNIALFASLSFFALPLPSLKNLL